MNIRHKVEEILRYFARTSGVGHTFSKSNRIVMALDKNHAKNLKLNFPDDDIISMHDDHALEGKNKPLLIDHAVIWVILAVLMGEIDFLQKRLDFYKKVRKKVR